MALEEKKKIIPKGTNYVRFTKRGFLYVEIGDKVVKIKDTLGNVKNYVYVKETPNGYEISLQPFTHKVEKVEEPKEEPKKRTTNRKKKDA